MTNIFRKATLLVVSLLIAITTTFAQKASSSDPFVIAHRGAWKEFDLPENSRASFHKALEIGCQGTELDVWLSADGVLVINHDPDHQGLSIEKTNYKDLKKVKLKNGEVMPTLAYFLKKITKQQNTTLIIDVKNSKISAEKTKELAQRCVEEVKKYKAQGSVQYLFGDYEAAKHTIAMDPEAKVSLLGWKTICAAELNLTAEQVRNKGVYGLDLNLMAYKERKDYIKEAKHNGLKLNAWTVNEETDMKWFIKNGFNYITTDHPRQLLSIWNK